MSKISIVEVDYLPVCPHCEKEMEEIAKINRGIFAYVNIYVCPHCRKVLGTTYNA